MRRQDMNRTERLWCRAMWSVATLLNRSRRVCWTDLAMWIVRYTSWRETGDPRKPLQAVRDLRAVLTEDNDVRSCVIDAGKCGVCYCGKFQTVAFQAEHVPDHYSAGIVVPEATP